MPPSQLYREIKQESELSRVYTREGSSPFSVKVEEASKVASQPKQYYQKEDGCGGGAGTGVATLCKVEGNGEESKTTEGHSSFNRDQIIVEVNLNNQTLNVSKGSEGKSSNATETATMFSRCCDNERDSEDDDGNEAENDDAVAEEDDDDDLKRADILGQSSEEEDEEEDEEEEENTLNIPGLEQPAMMDRPRRGTRALAMAGTTASMRQTLAEATLANQRQGGKRTLDTEGLGQKCVTCGKAFKKLWSLHEHNKIVHGYAEKKFSCEICEKKFYTMAHVRKHMVGKWRNPMISDANDPLGLDQPLVSPAVDSYGQVQLGTAHPATSVTTPTAASSPHPLHGTQLSLPPGLPPTPHLPPPPPLFSAGRMNSNN
ncbi:hypothetical protein PAMA_008543 [Pampus argenteus]